MEIRDGNKATPVLHGESVLVWTVFDLQRNKLLFWRGGEHSP